MHNVVRVPTLFPRSLLYTDIVGTAASKSESMVPLRLGTYIDEYIDESCCSMVGTMLSRSNS